MDPRRTAPTEQSQSQRFSWQLPLDDLPQQQPQRLQLDTSSSVTQQHRQPSNGGHHGPSHENRYSYAQTPAEHQYNNSFAHTGPHRPGQQGMSPIPQSPETPIDHSLAQAQNLLPQSPQYSAAYAHPSHRGPAQIQQHQQQHHHQEYPQEKSDHFKEPQQVHPAEYVPYTDSVMQTPTLQQQSRPSTTQTQPPPLSPGPLPLKSEQDFQEQQQQRRQTVRNSMAPSKDPNYVPHAEARIQSPKQPIFSPDSLAHPTTAAQAQPPSQTHQPGQISHPNMNHSSPGSSREWNHGLCGGDSSTCLEGIFCPCMVHSRTSYRLSRKSSKKDPTDLLGWSRFDGSCVLTALTCGLCGILPMVSRTRIRHSYHLEGSLPGDFFRSCCCCCCVIIQNESEIKEREDHARRWAGPGTGEVYTPAEQMVYAPPPR